MWKKILSLDESGKEVIAVLPKNISSEIKFVKDGIEDVFSFLNASDFFIDQEKLDLFITLANEGKKDAFIGVSIARKLNAQVDYELVENDMLANLIIIGSYGGRGLRGSEILHALAQGHITKGINKLALKKALVMSASLSPGETFTQPVAKGKYPVNGKDAKCIPLVEDVSKRVLIPQQKKNSEKLDMKNLGATVTVSDGDEVMRKKIATDGTSGFTVTGQELSPTPGKDLVLKAGKNTELAKNNSNSLIASISGLPLIKANSVDIDNAMVLKSVGIETGHVKFKGSLVVTGNIESGMVVRATGDIIIGGFVESADVQAQGNITIAKGIIGHTVSEDGELTCSVKSSKSITANYAQYSFLQAHNDIHLKAHSLSNQILCGRNLTVVDDNEKNGTLSGRSAKVGGKILCYNLGVEGDTATHIEVFAKYEAMKKRIIKLKEEYEQSQSHTMDVVRKEIEFNKQKSANRSEDVAKQIADDKKSCNAYMLEVKQTLSDATDELEGKLLTNIVDIKNHVYTHVSIQYGSEKILTKKEHGPTVFSFNQHEIKARSTMDSDDIKSDDEKKK